MFKKIVFIIFLQCGALLFAQYPLRQEATQLNIGAGFSSWGVPLYAGIDYGVGKDVSIGGEMSYRSYGETYDAYKYDHSVIGLSGNCNYHFNSIMNIPRQWDLYLGLNIGFYNRSSPGDYKGTSFSGLGLGAQIGGRYYFSPKVGVNLELGGGNAFSGGKIGVSFFL